MKRIYPFSGILIAVLAFAGTAWAANEPAPMEKKTAPGATMSEPGKLDRHDQEFLKKAAEINLVEIELGKVAEKNSSDPNIKQIAGHLIKVHSESKQKLDRLAASKGVTLPTEVSVWDRHSLSSLEKAQGDKFNKEFLAFNVNGHEKAVALFEKEAARTQDPDIKAWAQKTIPSLKDHLAMAQSGKVEAVGEKAKQQQQQSQQRQRGY